MVHLEISYFVEEANLGNGAAYLEIFSSMEICSFYTHLETPFSLGEYLDSWVCGRSWEAVCVSFCWAETQAPAVVFDPQHRGICPRESSSHRLVLG